METATVGVPTNRNCGKNISCNQNDSYQVPKEFRQESIDSVNKKISKDSSIIDFATDMALIKIKQGMSSKNA